MKKPVWLFVQVLMLFIFAGCGANSAPVEIGEPSGNAPHLEPGIIIIAASNASSAIQSRADYRCSGDGHDEIQIQNAIQSLPLTGDCTVLLMGDFIKGNAAGISIPSNTNLVLSGTLTLADNLNTDACIFTNSDLAQGNSHIQITGGRLVGNEQNNHRGDQYAFRFVNVTDSQVDCWIEDFRTADELFLNSQVRFCNRYYSDAYTPRIKYLSSCETVDDFLPSLDLSLCSKDFVEGQHSLEFTAASDEGNVFLTSAGFDLRFSPLIVMKYKILTGTARNFWAYLYNPRMDAFAALEIIKYADCNPGGWNLALLDISSFDWNSLQASPSAFLRNARFRLKIDGEAEGAAVKILIDDIYAVRGLNQAVITQVFDDGFASDYTQGLYLQKYGFKGVSAVISTAAGESNYLTVDQMESLYQSGWDICNHSYSHWQAQLSPGEQWIQDAAGRGYLEALGFHRSARYRMYVGSQSELPEVDSAKINSARRFMGTNELVAPSACLPYGYTQQALNSFWYADQNADVESKVKTAKKFHTWQIVSCHEITDTVAGQYKTPISVFQDFIDFLYFNGFQVKTFSEVYSQYPLASESALDFSLQDYHIQYQDLHLADSDYIVSQADLNGTVPADLTLLHQPDVPRTLTWSFNSHANITGFTLLITGKDAKGITQTLTLTDKDGWSGETSRDFAKVSIQLVGRTGTGIGDSLNIGIGSRIGLPGKIYSVADVFEIWKNARFCPSGMFQINPFYDTIDLSGGSEIAESDDFEIRYRSNLNNLSPASSD